MFEFVLKKCAPALPPVYSVYYTIEEAALLEASMAFTLEECERLLVKNKEAHGALFLSHELEALHSLLSFTKKQQEAAMAFLLKNTKKKEHEHER